VERLSFVKPNYRYAVNILYDSRGFPEIIEIQTRFPGGTTASRYRLVRGRGRRIVFRESDLVYLFKRYFEKEHGQIKPDNPLYTIFCFQTGLVYYYGGKKFQHKAKTFFIKAWKEMPESSLFLEKLKDIPSSQEEEIAAKLFEQIQEAIKEKNLEKALELFKQLKTQFSHTRFYKEKQKEIDKMFKNLESAIAREKQRAQIQRIFHGKVKQLSGGRIRLTYDFKQEKQLKDWYLERFRYLPKRKVVAGRGDGTMIHKAVFQNDVQYKVEFKLVDGRLIGYFIHLGGEDDREEGYLCVTSVDEGWGRFRMKGNPIFKLPVDFDKLARIRERTLDWGQGDFIIRKGKHTVKITRKGTSINVTVDRRTVAKANDKEFKGGMLGIGVYGRTRIAIKKFIITGKLDKEWLKYALEAEESEDEDESGQPGPPGRGRPPGGRRPPGRPPGPPP
jgi:hypothetical protein